jgi:hypothetical protein
LFLRQALVREPALEQAQLLQPEQVLGSVQALRSWWFLQPDLEQGLLLFPLRALVQVPLSW